MAGFVPAIHVLLWCPGVDARDKRGHDGGDWRRLYGKCGSVASPAPPAWPRLLRRATRSSQWQHLPSLRAKRSNLAAMEKRPVHGLSYRNETGRSW